MLDVPNSRSSHSRPTPRGGGVVIVTIVLILWLIWQQPLSPIKTGMWTIWAGACLVAITGWIDDVRTLPSKLRLVVHGLSAMLAIIGTGVWQNVSLLPIGSLSLGYLSYPLTLLWIVGCINAYNFMDGIDGIAGSQAIIAGIGWFVLGRTLGAHTVEGLGLVLAASSLGFLLHNWQPASIFMGDVASGFLGYMFAVLPLMLPARETHATTLWTAILLLWPFLYDAFLTFLRRLFKGENVLEAHRSHLYQRLVISGLSHQTVTLLYAGLATLGLVLAIISLREPLVWPYTLLAVLLCSVLLILFVRHRERNNHSR